MSKADEMFIKLGYCEKTNSIGQTYIYDFLKNNFIENTKGIFYCKLVDFDFTYIVFDIKRERVIKVDSNNQRDMFITVRELQAINEKVKELGWLDVK